MDVLSVFARGSGQNQASIYTEDVFNTKFTDEEPESSTYFKSITQHIKSQYPSLVTGSVTVHDFPGKYSDVGYRAASVGIESLTAVNNTLNADYWWAMGDYRASVSDGVTETTGYLKDQIAQCPDQIIFLGGYSQGAQVMGRTLFNLTEAERAHIAGVGLFGDPEYEGGKFNINDPITGAVAHPWQRGSAGALDIGVLDGRSPYLPDDIKGRVASYCYATDFICAGVHNMTRYSLEAHRSYKDAAIHNTTRELVYWGAGQLAEAEKRRGGFVFDANDPDILLGDQKARDIMIVFASNNQDSVVRTLRYYLDEVLYPLHTRFPDTYFGAADFGEHSFMYNQLDTPYVKLIHKLGPYTGFDPARPLFTLSTIKRGFVRDFPFGKPNTGAGDYFYNLQTAIEHTSLTTPWRDGAERHIILITDKPTEDEVTYNICSQPYRIGLPTEQLKSCSLTNNEPESWSTQVVPGVCKDVLTAMSSSHCLTPVNKVGTKQFVSRSIKDAITVAQASDVRVHTVLPYNVVTTLNIGTSQESEKRSKIFPDMKQIADETGGKHINYSLGSSYNQALFADTMYSAISHNPVQLKILVDAANTYRAGEPIRVSVAAEKVKNAVYLWDFNDDGVWDQETPFPTTTYTYDSAYTGFMTVGIRGDTGAVLAHTSYPITIESAPTVSLPPVVHSVSATRSETGELTISWQGEDEGELMVLVGDGAYPIGMADLSAKRMVIENSQPMESLKVVVYNDDSTAGPIVVPVNQEKSISIVNPAKTTPVSGPAEGRQVAIDRQPASVAYQNTPDNLQNSTQDTLIQEVAGAQTSRDQPSTTAVTNKPVASTVSANSVIEPIVIASFVLALAVGGRIAISGLTTRR